MSGALKFGGALGYERRDAFSVVVAAIARLTRFYRCGEIRQGSSSERTREREIATQVALPPLESQSCMNQKISAHAIQEKKRKERERERERENERERERLPR